VGELLPRRMSPEVALHIILMRRWGRSQRIRLDRALARTDREWRGTDMTGRTATRVGLRGVRTLVLQPRQQPSRFAGMKVVLICVKLNQTQDR
jgi:hypothetical protein